MNPIRILDTEIVFKFCDEHNISGEITSAENLLGEISQNIGSLVYLSEEFLQGNFQTILKLNDLVQFVLIQNDGRKTVLFGPESSATEDLFVRSAYSEQAAITYVHELNNHLAIICGRLYEFKKIAKSIEGELQEKFEKKLTSMNEKIDQVTAISRLFTRKSLKAISPSMGGAISYKVLVANIMRDYRKVLEKSNNIIDNRCLEDEVIEEEHAIKIENTLIPILLKLAYCSIKDGEGTKTTVSNEIKDSENVLTFVLEGEINSELQEYFYHRSWMNLLSSSQKKSCHMEIFQGKNKIHLELTQKNLSQ